MPDLTMYRGDTRELVILVNQNGQPVNLDGSKLWLTAKWYVSDPDNMAVIALTSETSGGIVFDPLVRGRAVATIQPISTRAFPDGPVTLQYDVQMKDVTGKVTTVERGTLTVTPDITRTIV